MSVECELQVRPWSEISGTVFLLRNCGSKPTVTPAQAGAHLLISEMGEIWRWIPAYAGMTVIFARTTRFGYNRSMSKARTPRAIKYDLKELLSGITPDNIHPEVDWGPDVGKEILPPWEGESPVDLEGHHKTNRI
jgi:hypothetical protein